MAQNVCMSLLLWLVVLMPSVCPDMEWGSKDRLPMDYSTTDKSYQACSGIHPVAKDIVRRFYAIVPYFDKDHMNSAFLHKYRGTIYGMFDSQDILDREVGYYAAVLTPVLFLQRYRDSWCLLERFHIAIRLFQKSNPTEKRSALKVLQNLRSVNQKIRSFIFDLSKMEQMTQISLSPKYDDGYNLND